MDDPIVKEVRKAREQIARCFDYDLHALFCDVRERQKSFGLRLVSKVKIGDPKHAEDKAVDP